MQIWQRSWNCTHGMMFKYVDSFRFYGYCKFSSQNHAHTAKIKRRFPSMSERSEFALESGTTLASSAAGEIDFIENLYRDVSAASQPNI